MGSMAENPILIDEMQYEKNFLLQQLQSLKNGPGVALKQKLGVSAITFKDTRKNISSFAYDCVYELKKNFFILSLSLSETRHWNCDPNTIILPLPKLFLVSANFCINHVHTEKKCRTPQRNQKLKSLWLLVQWLLSERSLFFHSWGR